MIVFQNVSFAYSDGEDLRPALTGVSFEVQPGRVVAVAGANGSGKSTLARLCDGLLVPSAGKVTVDGLDVSDPDAIWSVRQQVGMVFQDPDDQIVGAFVEEDVAFGPENLGVDSQTMQARVEAALAAVGLTGLSRREPHLLSEGQKQRLAVAGAIAMEPAYLVLDEPAAFLDSTGRGEILALIDVLARERGHGVLHVSHDLAGVANADEVLVLEHGELVFAGSAADLLRDPVMLKRAGLEMPPIGVLAAELRQLGIDVPASAMDAESVVASL